MDIFGAYGLADTDYAFINTIGQQVVYDATLQVLGDHNANLAAAESILVAGTTWDHTVRFKLPMEGYLQRKTSASTTMMSKPNAGWDVSFPLEEFGGSIGWDRVALAYMTMGQYDLAIKGILRKDVNTRRKAMLEAIFNNTSRTFKDENFPDLTIQPLANGDAVLYPPVIGTTAEATANNYLASGYVSSAISDTNDPIATIVNALEQYLGTPTGGSKIAVFCNNAETPRIQALTNFDAIPNRFVAPGFNTPLVPWNGVPESQGRYASDTMEGWKGPGRILGETDSALIVEWRWIPSGYLLGVHLEAPPPLRRRIDPPQVGLGDGLMLTTQDMDQPLKHSEWTNRFGYGVENRLNGVVMQLTAGSYTVPTVG